MNFTRVIWFPKRRIVKSIFRHVLADGFADEMNDEQKSTPDTDALPADPTTLETHQPSPDSSETESSSIPSSLSSDVSNEDAENTVESTGDSVPIVAEIVTDGQGQLTEPVQNGAPSTVAGILAAPAPMPVAFQNLAAVGGAVGALVLGIWSIVGALLTPYSGINAVIGLLMGLWGLSSRKRWMAVVGIIASLAGLMMSVMEVSNIIATFWAPAEDTLN